MIKNGIKNGLSLQFKKINTKLKIIGWKKILKRSLLFVILFTCVELFSYYLGLVVQGWITLNVFGFIIYFLLLDYEPSLVFLSSLPILIFSKCITEKEAIAGFSNEGVILILFLLIFCNCMNHTSFHYYSLYPIKKINNIYKFLFGLTTISGLLSVFIPNTPLTIILLPLVEKLSIKNNIPLNQLLIPLSFSIIIGGLCSIIGTSTNFVVQGLLQKIDPTHNISFFESGIIGFPLLAITILYLTIVSPKFLSSQSEKRTYHKRSYSIFTPTDDLMLYKMSKIKLFQGIYFYKPGTNHVIYLTDDSVLLKNEPYLIFGINESILYFYQLNKHNIEILNGLQTFKKIKKMKKYFEVTLNQNINCLEDDLESSHKNLIYNEHRMTFNNNTILSVANDRMKVILLNRKGKTIHEKELWYPFEESDVLTIESTYNLYEYFPHECINEIPFNQLNKAMLKVKKDLFSLSIICLLILLLMVGNAFIPIIGIVILQVMIVLMLGFGEWKEVLKEVNWSLIVLLASSISLGTALENTGIALKISNQLLIIFKDLPHFWIIYLMHLLTVILTAFLTNSGVVSFLIPICFNLANSLHLNPKSLYVPVMLGASCDFLTNFGYQTNIIVTSIVGYKLKDFLKIGLPMTIFISFFTPLISFLYYK